VFVKQVTEAEKTRKQVRLARGLLVDMGNRCPFVFRGQRGKTNGHRFPTDFPDVKPGPWPTISSKPTLPKEMARLDRFQPEPSRGSRPQQPGMKIAVPLNAALEECKGG
jgi:hypothetical protein